MTLLLTVLKKCAKVLLRVIELNRRFIHLKLKSILAHGINAYGERHPRRSIYRVLQAFATKLRHMLLLHSAYFRFAPSLLHFLRVIGCSP